MSYLIEKNKTGSGWNCRVKINDTTSIFLDFDHDPTYEEILDERQKYIDVQLQPTITMPSINNKSEALIQAEKEYVAFCRYLKLPEPTGTPHFDALCNTMKANGQVLEAMEVAIRALALINNITQNGGSWGKIDWTVDTSDIDVAAYLKQ